MTPSPYSDDMQRFLRLVIIFSLAISAIFICRYGTMIYSSAGGAIFAEDFTVFYRSAQVFSVSPLASPYNFASATAGQYYPYLNAPFFALLLWPLHFLPYGAALACCMAAQAAFWVAVLHAPSVRALWPALSQQKHYSLIVLAVSLPFAADTVMVGQLGLFYAALLLWGVSLLPSRPVMGGVVLALVTCKPTLALLLPVFLIGGKHWRACAAFAATVLCLSIAATAVWGAGIWIEWLHAMGLHSDIMQQVPLPHKFMIQMISPYSGLRLVGLEAGPALILQGIMAVLCSIGVFLSAWKKAPYPAQLALLFSSIFLTSFYVLQYDAVILAAGLLVMLNSYGSAITRISMLLMLSIGVTVPQFQTMGIPAGAVIILLFWVGCLRNIQPSGSPLSLLYKR